MSATKQDRIHKISELDAKIIEIFQENARLPIAQIAERLKTPESTIRHRVNRMLAGEFLQFSAWVNPTKLPNYVWVSIDLTVDLREADRVAAVLKQIEQVYFVAICSGLNCIQATAVFSSHNELLQFVRGPIAEIRGIEAINTSVVMKVVKRSTIYAAPSQLVTGPVKRKPPLSRKRS